MTIELIQIFVATVVLFKFTAAGGDDPCAASNLPFNKSEILTRVRNIEIALDFLNETAFKYTENLYLNIEAPIQDNLATINAIIAEATTISLQAQINWPLNNLLASGTTFAWNSLSLSNIDRRIAAVNFIQANAATFLDSIMDSAVNSLAPLIGLTSAELIDILGGVVNAQYPQSCVIDDIAFIKTKRDKIRDFLNSFGNMVKNAISAP